MQAAAQLPRFYSAYPLIFRLRALFGSAADWSAPFLRTSGCFRAVVALAFSSARDGRRLFMTDVHRMMRRCVRLLLGVPIVPHTKSAATSRRFGGGGWLM